MSEFNITVQLSAEVLFVLFHNTINPLRRRQFMYCGVEYNRSSWLSTRKQDVNVNVNVNQEFLTWLKQPELLRSPRKRSADI